ncbi:hypothetical protein CXG81DRAFT_21424 [Caulochytrium protostelioides]|uniref:Uncharacterized protein n=1 Tax=Caulochytrium protostelioides TaxID=1555241 RepID=A0A4P9X0V1_9FUNG|nr:hypothetical protein CXG81DRAFT_21424 [Caulochytrium protostelioides]|eukprot:RKO98328.1 hypothetical protein CXG81DRAFT_21424 [Caulochytrium protostelioides]
MNVHAVVVQIGGDGGRGRISVGVGVGISGVLLGVGVLGNTLNTQTTLRIACLENANPEFAKRFYQIFMKIFFESYQVGVFAGMSRTFPMAAMSSMTSSARKRRSSNIHTRS